MSDDFRDCAEYLSGAHECKPDRSCQRNLMCARCGFCWRVLVVEGREGPRKPPQRAEQPEKGAER